MYLEDLSKILYEPGTKEEERKIKIIQTNTNKVLWYGKVTELTKWENIHGWGVCQILVDNKDTRKIPEYNKNKIITVY